MIPEPHFHPRRIEVVRDRGNPAGAYVLYWMQGAQRAVDNHALEYAIEQANLRAVPVLVLFCLVDNYPEANERHYRFMVEGLIDVKRDLDERGIAFHVLHGDPVTMVRGVAGQAALVVTERAYLRLPKRWRLSIAESIECSLVTVDTNLVVPVSVASQKREYAARTIRPKIRSHFREFCRPVPVVEPVHRRIEFEPPHESLSLHDIDTLLDSLSLDRTVRPVSQHYPGGSAEALRRFRLFLSRTFFGYSSFRNEPVARAISAMSPYLHFGQISPVRLAIEVQQVRRTDEPQSELSLDHTNPNGSGDDGLSENRRTYLEELCVRRELAHNFVEYESDYDSYHALPQWARSTLADHQNDPRPAIHDEQTLEAAGTEDPYWNAAMSEMIKTGFMHNYMRMYWGKQIITWVPNPEHAFQILTRLNNRYFLDGRDPNSYTNVAWIFGLHDRPWPQRPVFGTVRSMNANGLRRKCDIEGYVQWVATL